jgi:RHS repeat-associated protein
MVSRRRTRLLELEPLEQRALPSSGPVLVLRGVPGKAPIDHELAITGLVSDAHSPVVSAQAQVDGGAPISLVLDRSGRFRFMTSLPVDGSADGRHTVQFEATDKAGHVSQPYVVTFTLDTIPPASPAFGLAPASDSPPLGDQQTYFGTVTLIGITEAKATVTLRGTGKIVHANNQGRFQFSGVPLGLGPNSFTVRATDAAGNHQDFTRTITRVPRTPVTIVLAEHGRLRTQQSTLVLLGPVKGTRTLQFHIDAHFDQGAAASPLQDLFLVYLVDPLRGNTLLDRGQPGTALFTLAGTGADYPAGLVGFDGANVTIDVSGVTKARTGRLVFQLLDTDADSGTRITVSAISETVNPNGTPSPVFPMSETLASAGPALNLTGLAASSSVTVEAHDVRLDSHTGNYVAELQVENAGTALGRQVVVLFPGLPAGVHLLNPSGKDAGGVPYISFQRAIADGGLLTDARSEPIQVTFTDPSQVRFNLTPQVLVGGPDQAPVLTPIGPLSVTPGARLVVPLQATDPDGDHVQFRIESAGPLPTGGLEGNTLVFTPTPVEVGSYTFTVLAGDGVLETSQVVTLTVASDSVTTTRLSGVVQGADGQPLANVPVAVGAAQVTTAADGSFLLDFGNSPPPATMLQIHGEQVTGSVAYPLVSADLSLLLGHDVFASVNNVMPKAIVLPAVDTGNAVTINPAKSTSVTTPKLPGAVLTIAAGTLQNGGGQPFEGALGLTQVPVATTSAPLPANVHPDLAVLVQPSAGGVTFTAAAPLTLPNRAGWKPGTAMDLWTLDPASGTWIDAGAGDVSKGGKIVQTTSGGVTSASLYFFAPHPAPVNDPKGDPRNLQVGMPAQTATVPFASTVELHTGAVEEDFKLPTYLSLGMARGLSLHYASLWADPQPIVSFGYDQLSVDSSTLLVATLAINRGAFNFQVPGFANAPQYGLSGGENFWTIPAGASSIEAALQADLSSQPTGVYGYTVTTGLDHFDGSMFTGSSVTSTGSLVQVNTSTSALGAGWSLAGIQQLIVNPDNSVLIVDGDGTVLLFGAPAQAGQPYLSPTGDFSTLVQNADGSFTRTLKDQTVYQFSAQGLLTSVTDRNGNQTSYGYDGSGRLTQITDPVGLVTTLAYANNQVTITDPANRVTLLQLDSSGNLVQITAPDSSTVHYAYDAQHHETQYTDQRGFTQQDIYGFHGRVIEGIRKDGSVVQLAPAETQALFPPAQTADPFHAPPALDPPGAEATNAGPNDVQVTTLDQLGQLISQSDSIGQVETLVRNNQGLITQFIDGSGNATALAYDANGNLIRWFDQLSGPFDEEADYRASEFPNENADAMAVVDVNGDGVPDIVASVNGISNTEGQVLVLPGIADANGKPTGTFGPATTYDLPFRTFSIAAGDLNGDGRPDLVLTSADPFANFNTTVAILMNKGKGTFAAPQFITMGHDMANVVLGDFNGDGNLDIATADAGDSTVSVRLGNGDGTFGPRTIYTVGNGFSQDGLVAGDLTGNGILDLVVSDDAAKTVTVLKGNGDGTFTVQAPISVPEDPGKLILADLNGDGHLDLVMTGAVLLGNGDDTFTIKPNPALVFPEAVADIEGNGHLDALMPGTGNGNVQGVGILQGNGDGTFASSPVVVGFAGVVFQVTAADLNGDGRPDIIASTDQGTAPSDVGDIAVRLNNGGSLMAVGQGGARTYTWDPKFNVLTGWTDELGNQTVHQLDAHGNVLSMTMGDMVTQHTYTPQGQVATTTDPLGNVTSDTYDAFGRVTRVTYADGSSERFQYDLAGNQIAVIDGNGHETDTLYDAMNRPILITDPLGNQTHFSYDLAGNLVTETDALNNTTTYVYDALNRRIKMIDPLRGETDYGYDENGNQVLIVDPLGHETQNIYDSRNRLIETIDPQGGITQYGYDLNGNPTSITDPAGNTTTFGFDVRNRLVSETDALGHTTEYLRNSLSTSGSQALIDEVPVPTLDASAKDPAMLDVTFSPDVTTKVNPDGSRIEYTYDMMKQLVTETWISAAGTVDNTIHYTYDMAGDLLTAVDNYSSLAFTYDQLRRIVSVDNAGTPNAPHVVLNYAYDSAGNLQILTDTVNGLSDSTITYTSDADNRIIEITLSGPGISPERVDLTYNQVGQLSTIDRFADLAGTQLVVHSAYTYDALNRLLSLTHTNSSGPLAFYNYTYFADGSIQTIVSIDGTATYSYDTTGQLKNVTYTNPSIPGESYSWDANGNPQASAVVIGPDNELLSDGTFNYAYDAQGNLIRRTEIATGAVREFVWDERNRLISVIDKDAAGHLVQEVDYTYDAFDRRISERVRTAAGSDVLTDFVYDQDNVLLDFVAPMGPSGPKPALAMRYLYGPAVDQIFSQQDGAGNVLWLLPDRLGSTRDLVDNSGTVKNHIIYDAFGKVIFQSNPTFATRYLFGGREFDAKTDLYYLRARYYDAGIRRFLNEDPWQFRGGDQNLFRYAHSNPVTKKDPSGRDGFVTLDNQVLDLLTAAVLLLFGIDLGDAPGKCTAVTPNTYDEAAAQASRNNDVVKNDNGTFEYCGASLDWAIVGGIGLLCVARWREKRTSPFPAPTQNEVACSRRGRNRRSSFPDTSADETKGREDR